MNRLILATLLAFAVDARHQVPKNKSAVAAAKPLPPAPPQAYRFMRLAGPGTVLQSVTLPPDVLIDASTAFNDLDEAAFIARWNDASGRQHATLFAGDYPVVAEGETIDGKTITRLSGASLALSNAGLVAYDATYVDASSPSVMKTGVFEGRHFTGDLPSIGGAADFVLLEDGRIAGRDGILLTTPVSVSAVAAASAAPPVAKTPANDCKGLTAHLSEKAKDWWRKHSPIQTSSGDPIADATKACGASAAQTLTPAVPPQPQASVRPVPERVVLPAYRTNCPAAAFPLPPEWQMGRKVVGPATSHGFEGAAGTRSYDSPLYGTIASPIRTTLYAGDCTPLLIAIGDSNMRGRFELWTAEGSFTYLKPDGSWSFPGIEEHITSASFVRPDSGLRINRKGKILVPVTLTQGTMLLIAQPQEAR